MERYSAEEKLLKDLFIGFSQSSRISGYNTVEAHIKSRLDSGGFDLGYLGSGVLNAVRALSADTIALPISMISFPDPFSVDTDTAFQAEGVALAFAQEGKHMGIEARLVGGQLVASLFGLRALAEAKSGSVVVKSKTAYSSKLELAKLSFNAYAMEMAEMVRSLNNGLI